MIFIYAGRRFKADSFIFPQETVMLTIYHTSFEGPLHPAVFSKHLDALPVEISHKISAFRRWQDAHASLLGKLLLKQGLEELGINGDLSEMKYTYYGRPYLDKVMDFNISHAGSHIVCAFADKGKIGIDIELVKPMSIEVFKDIFHEEEWNHIMTSADRYHTFYYYWTAKESIVKAEGGGLNIPLKKILVGEGKASLGPQEWYFKNIPLFENYILQVASDEKPGEIQLRKLFF